MPAERRLAEILPTRPAPVDAAALIEGVVVDDGVAYVSGVVAFNGADGPRTGKVGADLTVEEASAEAGQAVANALYRLIAALGSLDRVERVLKLTVFVNATESLTEQPEVADGGSRVLLHVLGERGRHARSAVGVASLPLGASVEIEMVVRVAS
ncbi:RidA family protein [Jiangella gansuensis]|uniref:RidA family protein n=1 Tax=Jiangella gansuensis TaxID=281473 RepID=UPI0004BA33DF|nr:RidA family protein [Jiangella gansuensis]